MISKFKRPKFIDNIPIEYKFISYDKRVFTLLHSKCRKEFNLNTFTIDSRLKNKMELCTNCNPLLGTITKNKLPTEYSLVSIQYPTYTIKHDSCGEVTNIKSSSLSERIKANFEICHACNPPIKLEKMLLPLGYEMISFNKAKRTIKHILCDSTFEIFQGVAHRRIRKNEILCPICNPLRVQIPIPNLLGKTYMASMAGDFYNLTHSICGQTTKVHRRTITFRLKSNIEPCTHCVPFQRQYSEYEMEMVKSITELYKGEIMSGGDRFRSGLFTLDCYLPELKLGIEFNGDYFHANPILYSKNDKIKNKTAEHIWNKDRRKIIHFRSLGIDILTVWEYDWLNNNDTIMAQIARKIQP